jgi:CrtC N-terminal lipocalin domain
VTPRQQQARNSYLGNDLSRGYLTLPQPAPGTLQFPHAHEVNLTALFGWYYVVGTAVADNGKHYGILLMLLSEPLLPPAEAAGQGLSPTDDMTTQLQLAVNEEGGRHYQARPTIVAGTTGLLEFKPNRFYSVMGKNRMESIRPDRGFFPMRIQAKGWDQSTNLPTPLQIDITFSSGSNPLIQGNNGCWPCCGRVGTLYYSIPQMVIDPAKSELTLNGRKLRLKSGRFWMDHQWGNTGNPKVEVVRAAFNLPPPGVPGWDFFAINFTGNRALVAVALHSAKFKDFYGQTGPTPPGTMTVMVEGKYVDEHDKVTEVTGEMSVTKWVRSTSTPDPALFAVSNVWFPDRWEFSFKSVLPPDIRDFVMAPLTNGDSTLYFAAGTQYQEAPVNLFNPQGEAVGTAFAEGTDYANVPVVQAAALKIAGLPNTPSVFTPPGPSDALKAASAVFLALDGNKEKLASELSMCTTKTESSADLELQFNGRYTQ